ncbi:hypothetical protein SSS_08951 [Sarcoptes scabiei]|uniref:Uncharacterized protein n=1 Tax=Sarcoptes scabiei TaxID=52283 RepID=A0A834RD44_SARSC|nr:hypothetical protein SSS_08951 [Sarcoptes scabiei]
MEFDFGKNMSQNSEEALKSSTRPLLSSTIINHPSKPSIRSSTTPSRSSSFLSSEPMMKDKNCSKTKSVVIKTGDGDGKNVKMKPFDDSEAEIDSSANLFCCDNQTTKILTNSSSSSPSITATPPAAITTTTSTTMPITPSLMINNRLMMVKSRSQLPHCLNATTATNFAITSNTNSHLNPSTNLNINNNNNNNNNKNNSCSNHCQTNTNSNSGCVPILLSVPTLITTTGPPRRRHSWICG